MAVNELTLAQIKRTLDELNEEIAAGKFPSNILKDLKLSVNHLRLTLWAIIAYEGKAAKDSRGVDVSFGPKLAEFRIKRLMQMLNNLRDGFEAGSVAPSHPELASLSSALESTVERIFKLTQKPN